MIFSSYIELFNSFLKNLFDLDDNLLKLIHYDYNLDQKRITFGDFSTNAPLIIAKHKKKTPKEISEEIISLYKKEDIIQIKNAGVGFLNFFLSNVFYNKLVCNYFYHIDKNSFIKCVNEKLSYNVEFVSANPTGPLHIGHGRGGIIGDVLSNVLKSLGHSVTKEFYINDAGKQIQKLGESFFARIQQELGVTVDFPENGYHGYYLIDLARKLVESDYSELLKKPISFFSEYAKNALLENIKATLLKYGIMFDCYFSEKSLHDQHKIDQILLFLEKNKSLYFEDGALFLNTLGIGDDKDRVLKKTDGTYTYAASEIAYIQSKIDRKFDKLIMILGQDHHGYLNRMYAMIEALGKDKNILNVILYQLVTVKESGNFVRLSKRKGNIVLLDDVIKEVGKDIARFFYLYRKADAHLDFDIDLALENSDKNPVYYIHYAYVRILSVLKKAEESKINWRDLSENSYEYDNLEKMILRKIGFFQEILEIVATNNQTHMIAYYLYEIAGLFHSFYGNHICVDKNTIDISQKRLKLLFCLKSVMSYAFDILGISKPDHM